MAEPTQKDAMGKKPHGENIIVHAEEFQRKTKRRANLMV